MDPLMTFAFLGSLGTTEMMMIFVVVLLLFGPKQLPQIAKTIGKGLRDIRRAANQIKHEVGLDQLDDIYPTARPSSPPRRNPSREPATVDSEEPATADSADPSRDQARRAQEATVDSEEPATADPPPNPSRELDEHPPADTSATSTATSTAKATEEPQLPRHGPQPEDEETP